METHEWLRRYAIENAGGFLSGSVSLIIGHPFDTVKVRLQAGHAQYSGAVDCLTRTVRAEGFRALYKGMLSPLLANSAMGAITFSTWQEAQKLLHVEESEQAPLHKVFTAGAIAGVVQCSLGTPMELIRTKLQVQHEGSRRYSGNLDCMRQIFHTEGLQGLYRGNVSMMLREAPAFGVFFSVYEGTKRLLCPTLRPDEHEPMWVEAAGGAVTGALTWTAVMPIDVISTRIQSLRESEATDPSRRSITKVAQKIYEEGGARAFYRGLPTAVLRGIVLNAVVFPVYETVVRCLT
jgi:solute carrier family 25 carnitine/acylcarnitine transporter 20/29